MSNPYNNEIIFNGQTLMSLKEDTVTPDKVLVGETFHDRSGAPQTGSLITHNVYDGLDSTSASDALSANQGRELNDKYTLLDSNKISYDLNGSSAIEGDLFNISSPGLYRYGSNAANCPSNSNGYVHYIERNGYKVLIAIDDNGEIFRNYNPKNSWKNWEQLAQNNKFTTKSISINGTTNTDGNFRTTIPATAKVCSAVLNATHLLFTAYNVYWIKCITYDSNGNLKILPNYTLSGDIYYWD